MTAPPRALVSTLVLLTALCAEPDAQVFRTGIDSVLLPVTVTDARNRLITDLRQDDFQVFEDGVPQEISVFSREPQPIALSLLVDSSVSMDEKLTVAQQAAVGFARTLRPHDVAQIIDFSSDIRIRQPFTNDAQALERAIRSIRTGGSTALYTAVYVALAELRRVKSQSPDDLRRQAIILLSDGEDNTSLKTYDDVADAVKESGVMIYAIGLREKETTPGVRRFNQGDFALRTFAQMTGGRVFFVDDVRQLPEVYLQVADELANQYFLGYNTKNLKRDGAWRQIAVRVTRPETVVRARAGYFGPGRAQ